MRTCKDLKKLFLVLVLFNGPVAESQNLNESLKQRIDSLYKNSQEIRQVVVSECVDGIENGVKTTVQEFYINQMLLLADIMKQSDFPGYDKVGKESSDRFCVLLEYCPHSDFQLKVLEKMALEVKKKNATGSVYANLIDKVNLNVGRTQVYGTQVAYECGKAVAKNLDDPETVDKRRASVGLEPLGFFLNKVNELHKLLE